MKLGRRLATLDRAVFGAPPPSRRWSRREALNRLWAPVLGSVLLGIWAVFVHPLVVLLAGWVVVSVLVAVKARGDEE
ncbi:MAG TPA: hypothetical protein VNG13_02495 [Mycobacteriales bacterium]|nr:hypothetical protein [Mycobacteriales bacterium]